jgi:hypothetical protein
VLEGRRAADLVEAGPVGPPRRVVIDEPSEARPESVVAR